ncbi:MAG: hypothetical protein J6W31_06820 [Clostridia bacterium]|nr:hypothetical protein [Clostridia bacterium]
MFTLEVAKLRIAVHNRFPMVEEMCRPYLSQGCPQFSVVTTEEGLAFERNASPEEYADDYLETLSVYREIGNLLPVWEGILFHGAVIEYKGAAYAFTAKSGTGKTTHITHWRRAFGEDVKPINGDKPILRYIDGALFACGTPWAGKEGLQRNVCVPLKGICFLSRGGENRISPVTPQEALERMLSQVYLPRKRSATVKALSVLEKILTDTPLWEMACTDSTDAALVAKDAMVKE